MKAEASASASATGTGRSTRGASIGFALGAIALWSTLASFGVALAHVPPFLLTGLGLVIGSVPAWPLVRRWRVTRGTLLLGVYGLFGFHLLLFVALGHAPPVEANLVNYLWPLLIVVLAPLLLPGRTLQPLHAVAAVVGFGGAALAILGGAGAGPATGAPMADGAAWVPALVADAVGPAPAAGASALWGYGAALGSAFVWATYSLLTRRVARFPTAAVGLFALVSGVLSLLCHAMFEPHVELSVRDGWLIAAAGLGPLGAAFYLWDAALKRGDPSRIGLLSYLTPLASTLLLIATTGREPTAWILASAGLIVGAAVFGVRAR